MAATKYGLDSDDQFGERPSCVFDQMASNAVFVG